MDTTEETSPVRSQDQEQDYYAVLPLQPLQPLPKNTEEINRRREEPPKGGLISYIPSVENPYKNTDHPPNYPTGLEPATTSNPLVQERRSLERAQRNEQNLFTTLIRKLRFSYLPKPIAMPTSLIGLSKRQKISKKFQPKKVFFDADAAEFIWPSGF